MVPSAGLTLPAISLPSSPVAFRHPEALLALSLAVLLYLIHRRSVRGLSPGRQRFALGLRLVIFAFLVIALAGPVAVKTSDTLGVAFLLDLSDSMTAAQRDQSLNWIREAMASKSQRDHAQIIVFARDALQERALNGDERIAQLASKPPGDQTDIAAAIRLAMSTLPSEVARKLVLLSDGTENVGNAKEEARTAAAAAVDISYVPLATRDAPEVLVRQVEAPGTLREQDSFSVRVVVDANVATPATLQLEVDGRLHSTHAVEVIHGSNVFSLPHDPLPQGFHAITVRLYAPPDMIPENNEGGTYTSVAGKPKVLLVEGAPNEGRYLVGALTTGGIDVVTSAPLNIPSDPTRLREFESVILMNVRADRISTAQQRAVKSYVQSLGGGLVVVGGDQSYGAGGYSGIPLEEALPVRMDLRSRKVQSSVALFLVVDTSGSMGEGPPGATKMDLAKKAALESAALLGKQDQIGLLAFEDGTRWVIDPTFLTDQDHVRRQIGTLAPGGGTEIYSALREAYQVMSQREAKVRHIILLTDGIAPLGDYEALTARLRRDNITLSTIAVGTDADFGLLRQLAESGNGRYYEGIDPFDVPQLAVKETQEVARAAIVEETVRPVRTGTSVMLDGIDLATMPPLAGYVATTAKPSSTPILVSKDDDPLLVEWQYGLGEVVVWASDAENRWSADWLTWPHFSQFWTQLVKRTIPSRLDRNLQISVQREGTQAHITVDALSDEGTYRNLLPSEANIVDPNGNQLLIALPQTAPGRYEGFFPTATQGAYAVAVTQRSPSDSSLVAAQSTGFAVSYSPEYRDLGGNPMLLSTLAQMTGGTAIGSPTEAFRHAQRIGGGGRELWPFSVSAALLLFLLDVATRRLRVSPRDVVHGLRMLREAWLARSRPIAQPAASRLLAAKHRFAQGSPRQRGKSDISGLSTTRIVVGSRSDPDLEQAARTDADEAAAIGARLMEAKNRANKGRP